MKFNKWFFVMLLILIAVTLCAEDWKYTSNFNLALTQNAYSNSWAGTELGSISWAANANSTADKQLSKLILNKNTLKLAFGQTHSQKLDANNKRYWAKPEKTTDKIDFESVVRFTMHGYVDPFISGRFESQFIDYSDLTKTRIINPVQLTESAGIAKTFIDKPDQNLNSRLGGAMRERIDRERLEPTPSTKRKTYTESDAGIDFVTIYNMNYKPKDITFSSRLELFQALYNSKSKDMTNNNWKATDVTWENTVGMKLYGAFTIGLYMELLYDKEQEKRTQFKETLGLGFSYQLL
jgi:hypothetical protein